MSAGLTTQAAFNQLHSDLSESLRLWEAKLTTRLGWPKLLRRAVSHRSDPNGPYCWAFLTFQLLSFAGFLLSAYQTRPDRNVLISATVLFLLILLNLWLSVKLCQLRQTEILRKGQVVADRLEEIIKKENLAEISTFDLFAPASECVSLQWTYRDGQLVNLPTIMLVRHDVILLRPGREAPCSCRIIDTSLPPLEVLDGQQYFRDMEFDEQLGAKPVVPVLCEVLETPARLYFEKCAGAHHRNSSVFENEVREVLHRYGERLAIPALLVLTVLVGIFRYFYQPETSGTFYEVAVLYPATVLVAISSFTHLPYLTLLNLFCTSRVVRVFLSGKGGSVEFSRRSTETIEIFTDSQDANEESHWGLRCIPTWNIFRRLLMGDPKYLTYSANIVQTLGNVTNLSIVDKKGILSWPNPTPEKLFFIHHPYQEGMGTSESEKSRIRPSSSASESESSEGSPEGEEEGAEEELNSKLDKLCHGGCSNTDPITEVLDFTHDPDRAFSVHFDDPKWQRHLHSLKPIGLNIFLNSCAFKQIYTKFIDHLHVVSESVPRTIAVVNRRCLCSLAEVMGFRPSAKKSFSDPKVLCCYRRTPGELPLPGLTKHRTPLPNMFSVIVKDKVGGKQQCFSQGTADLMLDACEYFWDGKEVKRLGKSQRKKILDFYHRYSMTTYCLGFSYSPVNVTLAEGVDKTFMEWPTADMAYLMKPINNNFDLSDPAVLREIGLSLDSLLADEFFDSHEISSPIDCLRFTHQNQIFLGLVALQYQAKPDVVRMVEQLDKACIRFVHFSKENELRSRVFAEKMGLEAGWNCHISLSSEGSTDDLCVGGLNLTRVNSYKSFLRAPTVLNRGKKNNKKGSIGSCLSLPGQLKFDLPVVHFKCSPEPNESQRRFAPLANTSSVDSVFSVEDSREGSDDDDEERQKDREGETLKLLAVNRTLAREPTTMLIAADNNSHTSIVTSVSNSTTGFNSQRLWPQFASGLPKGIENVRPHLQNVDNVPLLVPLFTDTNSAATCEMIRIMQEWGEVVCVGGSSANHLNAEVFLQADCAIGIEPLQPAICVNETIKTEKNQLDSMRIVNLLASLPCSLSIGAGQHISLLQLIAESRHLLKAMRNSLVFLLQTSFAVAIAQLLSLLAFLPPIFSPGICLWLVCFLFPILSASLCGKPYEPSALKLATSKNDLWIRSVDLLGYLLGFSVKFLPSVLVCLVNFRLCLHQFCSQTANASVNCGIFDVGTNQTELYQWNGWSGSLHSGLTLAQNVSGSLLVLFVCVISASFVNQRSSLWSRTPFVNLTWLITVVAILLAQLTFFVVDQSIPTVSNSDETSVKFSLSQLPFYTYIIAVVWPIAGILPSVELLKYREILLFNRDQRRRRLAFTTKLGMNSPFG